MCCEPFVSGDRPAVVSHHCPWSPFTLNKQIQSSFQHSREWWRAACLYSVRPLMESLTVRGIRNEDCEPLAAQRRGGATKKSHSQTQYLTTVTTVITRLWNHPHMKMHNDAWIKRSLDHYTSARTMAVSHAQICDQVISNTAGLQQEVDLMCALRYPR